MTRTLCTQAMEVVDEATHAGCDARHETDLRGIGPGADLCYFHGEEPMPEDNYRTCGECGHYWTRDALVAADAEHRGSREDPERIWSCPLCIHDF